MSVIAIADPDANGPGVLDERSKALRRLVLAGLVGLVALGLTHWPLLGMTQWLCDVLF